ncbi:hypothetical protein BC937DRAFT_89143 [Endogone sp. FLAS-F59071]|nr:hypothetical protein BC937DRAFT_89143 [Endogone sp. FLAS-F59071]|eukprot:RUS18103.1 hypothetical protein BC937DRAFT_89143 [Endogone sp. FLAS-F59071]
MEHRQKRIEITGADVAVKVFFLTTLSLKMLPPQLFYKALSITTTSTSASTFDTSTSASFASMTTDTATDAITNTATDTVTEPATSTPTDTTMDTTTGTAKDTAEDITTATNTTTATTTTTDTTTETATSSPSFIDRCIPKFTDILKNHLDRLITYGVMGVMGYVNFRSTSSTIQPSPPTSVTTTQPSVLASVSTVKPSAIPVIALPPVSISTIQPNETSDTTLSTLAPSVATSFGTMQPDASSVSILSNIPVVASRPSSTAMENLLNEIGLPVRIIQFISSSFLPIRQLMAPEQTPSLTPTSKRVSKKPIAATVRRFVSSARPPSVLRQALKAPTENNMAASVQKSASSLQSPSPSQPQHLPKTAPQLTIAAVQRSASSPLPISLPSLPQPTSNSASAIASTIQNSASSLRSPSSSLQSQQIPKTVSKTISKQSTYASSPRPSSSSSSPWPQLIPLPLEPQQNTNITTSEDSSLQSQQIPKTASKTISKQSTYASSPRPSSSSSSPRPQLIPLPLEPQQNTNIITSKDSDVWEPLYKNPKEARVLVSEKPASRTKETRKQVDKITDQTSSSKDTSKSLLRKRPAFDDDEGKSYSRGKKHVRLEVEEKMATEMSVDASGKNNFKRKRVDKNGNNTGAKRRHILEEDEHEPKDNEDNVSFPVSGSTPAARDVGDNSGVESSKKRKRFMLIELFEDEYIKNENIENKYIMKKNDGRTGSEKKRKRRRAEESKSKTAADESKVAADSARSRKENKSETVRGRSITAEYYRGGSEYYFGEPERNKDRRKERRKEREIKIEIDE